MERRYLAATVAMAAIFALFSHAFGSGLLTKLHQPRTTLISEARCAAQTLRAHLLDKVNRSLGGGNPAEEAQLRVEFNLPAPALAAAAPAPALPVMKQVKAPAPPAVACRVPRLSAQVNLPRNFDRMVQQNVDQAVRAQMVVLRTQLQSGVVEKAVARAQREAARAGVIQARVNAVQMRVNNFHDCPSKRAVRMSADNGGSDSVDWNELSNEIEQEVSRSVGNSARNF